MQPRLPSATSPSAPDGGARLVELVRGNLVWALLAGMATVLAVSLEPFATPTNLVNIAQQVALVGLLAIGVTLVLIAGHFDLSVGATLTLAAVLAIIMQPVDAQGTLLAIVVPIAAGIAAGAINGALVGGLGANSIIVTVGMQLVLGGLTLLLVAGQHVRVDGADPVFVWLGSGRVAGLPVPVWVMLAVVLVAHVAMTRTVFGRHLLAVGGNPVAAGIVGIPVARRIAAAYVVSGALAALAGVLLAARVRNLDPTAGAGYEFAALTAVVLGGTRLTGGGGSALRTLAGVLILGMVANAMRLLDLSYSLQLLLQGLVLAGAVALEAWLRPDGRR